MANVTHAHAHAHTLDTAFAALTGELLVDQLILRDAFDGHVCLRVGAACERVALCAVFGGVGLLPCK